MAIGIQLVLRVGDEDTPLSGPREAALERTFESFKELIENATLGEFSQFADTRKIGIKKYRELKIRVSRPPLSPSTMDERRLGIVLPIDARYRYRHPYLISTKTRRQTLWCVTFDEQDIKRESRGIIINVHTTIEPSGFATGMREMEFAKQQLSAGIGAREDEVNAHILMRTLIMLVELVSENYHVNIEVDEFNLLLSEGYSHCEPEYGPAFEKFRRQFEEILRGIRSRGLPGSEAALVKGAVEDILRDERDETAGAIRRATDLESPDEAIELARIKFNLQQFYDFLPAALKDNDDGKVYRSLIGSGINECAENAYELLRDKKVGARDKARILYYLIIPLHNLAAFLAPRGAGEGVAVYTPRRGVTLESFNTITARNLLKQMCLILSFVGNLLSAHYGMNENKAKELRRNFERMNYHKPSFERLLGSLVEVVPIEEQETNRKYLEFVMEFVQPNPDLASYFDGHSGGGSIHV